MADNRMAPPAGGSSMMAQRAGGLLQDSGERALGLIALREARIEKLEARLTKLEARLRELLPLGSDFAEADDAP